MLGRGCALPSWDVALGEQGLVASGAGHKDRGGWTVVGTSLRSEDSEEVMMSSLRPPFRCRYSCWNILEAW